MKSIFFEPNISNYIIFGILLILFNILSYLIINKSSNKEIEDFSSLRRAVALSNYRKNQAKKRAEVMQAKLAIAASMKARAEKIKKEREAVARAARLAREAAARAARLAREAAARLAREAAARLARLAARLAAEKAAKEKAEAAKKKNDDDFNNTVKKYNLYLKRSKKIRGNQYLNISKFYINRINTEINKKNLFFAKFNFIIDNSNNYTYPTIEIRKIIDNSLVSSFHLNDKKLYNTDVYNNFIYEIENNIP